VLVTLHIVTPSLPFYLFALSLPFHPPPLQIARVRNQLEYERRSSSELAEAIAAKEVEVERERAALEKRQEEEKQYAKDNQAVQVGFAQGACAAGWGGMGARRRVVLRGKCGCRQGMERWLLLAAVGRQDVPSLPRCHQACA
jgi:hypothetical protein